MKRAAVILAVVLVSCTDAADPPASTEPGPEASSTTGAPAATTSRSPVPATTVAPATATTPPTTRPPVATTAPPATQATTTTIPVAHVTAPGTYADRNLVIHIGFVSEVDDVTSSELEAVALAVLNAPDGWNASGFLFVADAESELRVILAEGSRVDELCLPLETYGRVSCQNGAVVALNADRWRRAGSDWDSTVEDYRIYLINHEVGHLVGLRHPRERCPTPDRVSAAMEPQTNVLGRCVGNGIPLAWEIEWALNRPAVVGPTPDWEGPRPTWPVP